MKRKLPINFQVYLNVQRKQGKDAIEIRSLTCNPVCIKNIIEAALLVKPIIVFPTFRDKLMAIATLSERKILKYDYDKGIYQFLI